MPYLLQIDCVSKDERLSPYERIQRVGGPNSPDVPAPDSSSLLTGLRRRGLAIRDDVRWSLPVDEAIAGVLKGTWTFFIHYNLREIVNVEVATSPGGRPYLKAEVDRDTPDELLYLPECRPT